MHCVREDTNAGVEKITGTVMGCSVGYYKRRDKYGMRKGNTLKVDVVGENTKRRRLMVVKLFLGKLVNNNSGETAEHPRRRKMDDQQAELYKIIQKNT
jgi:hypothetical protein